MMDAFGAWKFEMEQIQYTKEKNVKLSTLLIEELSPIIIPNTLNTVDHVNGSKNTLYHNHGYYNVLNDVMLSFSCCYFDH